MAAAVVLVLTPCEKKAFYVSIGLCGLANGVLLTSSCKPIPNELGGKFAAQIYAFTNTVSNLGSILGISTDNN